MFIGRCDLKQLSLAGHGSGKYPAVHCICNLLLFQIPPTKSWPFREMMEELAKLSCFSSPLAFSFSSFFFFHFFPRIIEDWSFVYVRLRGEFGPSFCQLFQNRFKVWRWLWAGALWHLASVQRFASGASIWDLQMTWAAPCSWQLRWFSNAHTVMCDMMWLGHQLPWWINWFIKNKKKHQWPCTFSVSVSVVYSFDSLGSACWYRDYSEGQCLSSHPPLNHRMAFSFFLVLTVLRIHHQSQLQQTTR